MRVYVANPRRQTLRWPIAPGVVVLVPGRMMIETSPEEILAVPGLKDAVPVLMEIGFIEIAEGDDDDDDELPN